MFYASLNHYGNRVKSDLDILLAFDSRADRDAFVSKAPEYRQLETRADARREYPIDLFKTIPSTCQSIIQYTDSLGCKAVAPYIHRI